MSLILSGTDGLSDIDGSAATPAIRGTDANTGIFFPAADTIAFAEGGVEAMRIDSSGNVGIGTTSPAVKLHVSGGTQRIQSTGSTSDAFLTLQNDVGTQAILGIISSGNSPANTFFIETNAGKTVYVTSAGLFQFNNGYGSVATAYGCRAWVSFNGAGTVSIRKSANVSSITDVATGRYVMNFTTAMPDGDYSAVGNATKGAGGESQSNSSGIFYREDTVVSTSIELYVMSFSGSAVDRNYVMMSIFR